VLLLTFPSTVLESGYSKLITCRSPYSNNVIRQYYLRMLKQCYDEERTRNRQLSTMPEKCFNGGCLWWNCMSPIVGSKLGGPLSEAYMLDG
jgi:hypothetical protein